MSFIRTHHRQQYWLQASRIDGGYNHLFAVNPKRNLTPSPLKKTGGEESDLIYLGHFLFCLRMTYLITISYGSGVAKGVSGVKPPHWLKKKFFLSA